MQSQLIDWITSNVANRGFSRFEDLHIEELTPEFAHPNSWLNAIGEVCLILNRLRFQIPQGFTVCIGVSLRSDQTPIGITFQNDDQLADQFTYSSPSIYVFENGSEPWAKDPVHALYLPPNTFSWDRNAKNCVHFEYQAPYESDYRRSFWVVI